jgi:hypothetical protein
MVMENPLVTVIGLCYNQARFVREAIESVYEQTYPNIQLILVDDASSDGSKEEILRILENHPAVLFLSLQENAGNCKAFNRALAHAKGKYIIDFATDDVMMPDRIERQVAFFEKLAPDYGIIFSDSAYIDEKGEFLYHHTASLIQKGIIKTVPEGDVFTNVIERYFISSPSMMIRVEVLTMTKGYDEDLAYEDFDLWIRASRHYKFAYQKEVLTKVRKLSRSMSTGWYAKGNPLLLSTYKICLKAKSMLRTEREKKALIKRVRYELRQSVFSENHKEAELFFLLLKELTVPSWVDQFLHVINKAKFPLSGFRSKYNRLRYS